MGTSTSSNSRTKPWYKELGVILGLIVFALISYHQGIGPVPAFFAILSAALASSIIIVPTFHYGVHEFLGKRTGRVSLEGPTITFPFLGNVILVSCELKRIPFEVIFTSKDEQEIKMKGELQYRADPDIVDNNGRNVHVEISEDILQSGINEAIESKIAALGGVKNLTEFISNRKSIEDYLNCAFRLSSAPHLEHDNATCGVTGCKLPSDIMANRITNYYNSHHSIVKTILDHEDENSGDRSVIENRYGINVVSLPFGSISFSEETKKSMEKKEQVKSRQEAYQTTMKMIKDAIDSGATFEEAADAAHIALEPEIARNKKIISVQGNVGVLGALLANFSTGDATQNRGSKKKGGI